MTEETKQKLIKRLKSLTWRTGCVMVVAGLNYISQRVTSSSLSPEIASVVGILLGEATKYVNNHTEVFGAKLK